jgi:hypothetical protein
LLTFNVSELCEEGFVKVCLGSHSVCRARSIPWRLIDPFWCLVAKETVPDELVGKGEDDGVHGGHGVETTARGQGQEDTGGEEEEEESSRQ